jgi:LysR family glycine cleavage system transcriptional activator
MADRLPSLRGIEAFACVSEVLNLRVASERLNITVSAISHRIQGLEAELGVKLFDRSPQGLKLTPEGKAFRARLLPGLQALQDATRAAAPAAQKRVLRISAPPILHDHWLLPRLHEFTAARPGSRVELLTHGRKRALGSDISIAPLTSATMRDGAVPLFSYHATPMCSPDFASRHVIATPEQMLGLPLIDVVPTLPSWSYWFAAAGLAGEIATPAVLVDNQLLLATAMRSGLGVGLGSRALFADQVNRGELVCPFELEVPMPPLIGITARNEERETRALAEWIRADALRAFGPVEA